MGSWMKRIKLLLLVFPPRASSQLFLPPSSNLLPVIEPLSDPFVDVFEFGGVDQDHHDVDQDHVDQDHFDQDHLDQDHVDKGLLGLYPQIYTVLNFGMTIFNFHLLLLFLANLTRNWVIFDEKMERQA